MTSWASLEGLPFPLGATWVAEEQAYNCAPRPSGTEAVYKLYAEGCRGLKHLRQIQEQAQKAIQQVFRAAAAR